MSTSTAIEQAEILHVESTAGDERGIRAALTRVSRAQRAAREARTERVAAMDAAYAAGASISSIAAAAGVNSAVAWRTVLGRRNPTQASRA